MPTCYCLTFSYVFPTFSVFKVGYHEHPFCIFSFCYFSFTVFWGTYLWCICHVMIAVTSNYWSSHFCLACWNAAECNRMFSPCVHRITCLSVWCALLVQSTVLSPLMELPVPQNHRELKRCLGMFAYYSRWIKNHSGKVKPLTIKSVAFPLSVGRNYRFKDCLDFFYFFVCSLYSTLEKCPFYQSSVSLMPLMSQALFQAFGPFGWSPLPVSLMSPVCPYSRPPRAPHARKP